MLAGNPQDENKGFKGKVASCGVGFTSRTEAVTAAFALDRLNIVENSQKDSKGKVKSRNTSANRDRRPELKVDEARPRQVEETGKKIRGELLVHSGHFETWPCHQHTGRVF